MFFSKIPKRSHECFKLCSRFIPFSRLFFQRTSPNQIIKHLKPMNQRRNQLSTVVSFASLHFCPSPSPPIHDKVQDGGMDPRPCGENLWIARFIDPGVP